MYIFDYTDILSKYCFAFEFIHRDSGPESLDYRTALYLPGLHDKYIVHLSLYKFPPGVKMPSSGIPLKRVINLGGPSLCLDEIHDLVDLAGGGVHRFKSISAYEEALLRLINKRNGVHRIY